MRFPILSGPLTPVDFASRFEPGVHEGIDVFAPAGAELVAIEAGRVRQMSGGKGGHTVYLTTEDGTQYYYAHLDAFSHPLMPGESRWVEEGDSLGYVGTSGNARGKAPHLHLEVRPRGGAKVDPFPLLTRLAALEERRIIASKPADSRRAPRSAKARAPKRPAPPRKRPEPVVARPSVEDWGVPVLIFAIAWAVGSASTRRRVYG